MPLSAELITRYTTEADQDWWQGLILSHSLAGTVYLTDYPSAQTGNVDGTARTFAAVPWRRVEPTRDAEGLQQLSLQICALGSEAVGLLESALADPTERIRCRWGVWLVGDPTQQVDPLPELSLTDVTLTDTLISATATAADILSRPFPSVLYRVDTYPGLDRR